MLPRRKNPRALILGAISAVGICASALISPAGGIVSRPVDPVVSEIPLSSITQSVVASNGTAVVIPPRTTSIFTLVAVTWTGAKTLDGEFFVKVREAGKWTDWFELHHSDDHGPDAAEIDTETRQGTDPLLTAPADGVAVKFVGDASRLPSNVNLTLIDSRVTNSDRELISSLRNETQTPRGVGATPIPSGTATATPTPTASATPTPTPTPSATNPNVNTSPQGAVVPMPTIVTRAQWGANESWRDAKMRYSTSIIAGFVHHTATTNSYAPSDGPAQMRVLYAYFTKSLKYADMGYNFLVDQYGVLYEGRSGGMNRAVIGGHTAGMNSKTFAVSAIGNYDVKDLSTTSANAMTTSISQLFAWKLAKYGLDANGTARILSTDTSGRSQYSKGKTAITPVISGHRDVGRTACPGRYLYPYIPSIRAKAAELLTPIIQQPAITPAIINAELTDEPVVSALIPANATWRISIYDAAAKRTVRAFTGNVTTTSTVSVPWDRKDTAGADVSNGTYTVTISAKVGTQKISPRKLNITIGTLPTVATSVKISNAKAKKVVVTWKTATTDVPAITSTLIRVSRDGVNWGKWKSVKPSANTYTYRSLAVGVRYTVQIRTRNAVGKSEVVTKTVKPKR